MKALIALVSVLSFILGSLSVQAASHPRTYTATINKDGTVLTQTPQWIATVEHTNQDDYAALYNVKLVPSAFKKAPAILRSTMTAVCNLLCCITPRRLLSTPSNC